jgi:hypothetical protein
MVNHEYSTSSCLTTRSASPKNNAPAKRERRHAHHSFTHKTKNILTSTAATEHKQRQNTAREGKAKLHIITLQRTITVLPKHDTQLIAFRLELQKQVPLATSQSLQYYLRTCTHSSTVGERESPRERTRKNEKIRQNLSFFHKVLILRNQLEIEINSNSINHSFIHSFIHPSKERKVHYIIL